VTLLGYRNPLRRVSNAIRGVLHRPAPPTAVDRTVFVVGHRGAPREAPENTIASFARAVEVGADGIEADVCVTRDGRFVLWHDCRPEDKAALARQAGGEKYLYEPDVPAIGSRWRRPVNELDLGELRAHYGYVPSDGDDRAKVRVPIALLEDLFAWSKSEPRLKLICLDVKLGPKETAAARSLVATVREATRSALIPEGVRVALLCPQREILQSALTESRRESAGPRVDLFADFEFPGAMDFTKRYGADCVSFGVRRRFWADLRHEVAHALAARNAGRIERVIVWTVNDEERLRELVSFRPDGILTDHPAMLRRIVSEKAAGA
jgi:glycerophosphoryl diester phosphodiesterase